MQQHKRIEGERSSFLYSQGNFLSPKKNIREENYVAEKKGQVRNTAQNLNRNSSQNY